MTDKQRTSDRTEALAFIVCRLDELRQMAASHGLDLLGYLLEIAFTESCDMIRKEHPSAQAKPKMPIIPGSTSIEPSWPAAGASCSERDG